jgi:hypothetical protein
VDSSDSIVTDASSLLWAPKLDRLCLLEQNTLLVRPSMSQLVSWGHSDGSVCLISSNLSRSEKTAILSHGEIQAVHPVALVFNRSFVSMLF